MCMKFLNNCIFHVYLDEGVYVNTYGKVSKNIVLQWGEMPTSVGKYLRNYIF